MADLLQEGSERQVKVGKFLGFQSTWLYHIMFCYTILGIPFSVYIIYTPPVILPPPLTSPSHFGCCVHALASGFLSNLEAPCFCVTNNRIVSNLRFWSLVLLLKTDLFKRFSYECVQMSIKLLHIILRQACF